MGELSRRISAALVLSAEAVAAILIHESVSLYIVAPIAVVLIGATSWLLDSAVEVAIKRSDRVAMRLGAKLSSGATVHGWWYTKIYRDPDKDDDPRELLGGSVIHITATVDGFELVGDSYMFAGPEWTAWGGHGFPTGLDGIVYSYRGAEAAIADEGFGLDSFYVGDPQMKFTGDFYGRRLLTSRHRSTEGERCPPGDFTPAFRRDPDERRRCLLRYLQVADVAD